MDDYDQQECLHVIGYAGCSNQQFFRLIYMAHEQQVIDTSQIQRFQITDDMTIKQLRKKWYDSNKQQQDFKFPDENYVIMWQDQFPLYDYYTIHTIKQKIGLDDFNTEKALLKVWYEWKCPYKQDEAALTFENFIKTNQNKYEVTIKTKSKNTNEDFYFYLPCRFSTTIKDFKSMIREYFTNKFNKNLPKYKLLMNKQSIQQSFEKNKMQKDPKLKQQIDYTQDYVDFTKCQIDSSGLPICIAQILQHGHIIILQINDILNIANKSQEFKYNPLIKITCFERTQKSDGKNAKSSSIIKQNEIKRKFSEICNLKVETLLFELKLEDAHFTSLYNTSCILKPEDKFQQLKHQPYFKQSQQILFVSIPENILFYKQVIELDVKNKGKNMDQIFEIINKTSNKTCFSSCRIKSKQRKQKIKEQQFKKQDFLDPIILYTSPYMYLKLNQFMRNSSISRVSNNNPQTMWHYPFCEKLLRSLLLLHNYQGNVYRGSKQYEYNYKEGQVIEWNGFNSTSKLLKQAIKFLKNQKLKLKYLFEIQTYSGKEIENFSYFSFESEVIILPYTRFKIMKIQRDIKVQGVRLTRVKMLEIPIPKRIPGHIIVWIDSNYKQNFGTYQKIVKHNNFQNYDLIQLTTNDHFKIWIEQYRQVLNLNQVKVHFITNMNRTKQRNRQGLQTLQIIREFRPNALVVFYIGDIQKTKDWLNQWYAKNNKDGDKNVEVVNQIGPLNQIFAKRFNKQK